MLSGFGLPAWRVAAGASAAATASTAAIPATHGCSRLCAPRRTARPTSRRLPNRVREPLKPIYIPDIDDFLSRYPYFFMQPAPRVYRAPCCSPGRKETSFLHSAQASSYEILLALAADAVVAGANSAAADKAMTTPKSLDFNMAFLPILECTIEEPEKGSSPTVDTGGLRQPFS